MMPPSTLPSNRAQRWAALLALAGSAALAAPPPVQPLAAAPATAASEHAMSGFDGVVEAVRQSVIAAQVAGAVVQLEVKAGDRVKAGQLLLRIDARGADQAAAASDAQVRAAQAAQALATQELERQRQLFAQQFISRAAFERAQAEFKMAQAQAAAQIAQAGAARTQSGLHTVRAPYAGVIAEVPVALGDMALPGRALITLYDPTSLRVTASLPQSVALRTPADSAVRIELPGQPADRQWLVPTAVQRLPSADAATHTVPWRADLPATEGVAPGQFARLWLPAANGRAASPWVPLRAVVRRAELTAVYVQSTDGRALLRQVRLGRSDGERIEVLSGLAAGERVIADPQAAARLP